jgi:hypothetical protein
MKSTNRTQELIALIEGGTHRIDPIYGLCKWIECRQEWIYTQCGFRKDVINRAVKATSTTTGATA